MKKVQPNPFEHIAVCHRVSVSLGFAEMMGDKDTWEIVEEAVDAWMRKHAPGTCNEPAFAGYQWKGLFLPDSTVLRTIFKGASHHCHVESDKIIYQGNACSPNGFVSAVGGIRRNAWKSIWVLLPDAKHWQLADTLRVRSRSPSSRRPAHRARPEAAPPAAQPRAAQAVPATLAGRAADIAPATPGRRAADGAASKPARRGADAAPPMPARRVSDTRAAPRPPAGVPSHATRTSALPQNAPMLFAFPHTGHTRWTSWSASP